MHMMKLSSLLLFILYLDTGQGQVLNKTTTAQDQCRNIIDGCSCPLKTQPHYLRCMGLKSDLPVILTSLDTYDIKLLDLSLRGLDTLEEGVITTDTLSALVISSSQLRFIEANALQNLRPSLTALSLPNNLLKTIPDEVFTLKSLSRLDLSQNEITFISQKVAESANLEFLNLAYNAIDHLNFKVPVHLQRLILKHNQLEKNSMKNFQFGNLIELDVSYNQLNGTLEQNTFMPKNSLRKLDLSFNYLTDLKNQTFMHFSALQTLKLKSNNIQLIHSSAFQGLIQLKNLDLSSNGILELPLSVFSTLAHLESLDLSFNHLQVISGTMTSGLINLHTLNLGHNDIIKLEPLKDVTMTLSTLLLDSNSLDCTCQLKAFQLWLQSLSHLSLNSKRSIKCSLPSQFENAILNNLEPLTCSGESVSAETSLPKTDLEEFQLKSKTLQSDNLNLKWSVNLSDFTCDQVQLYAQDEERQVQFYSAPLDCLANLVQINLDLKKVGILAHNIHPVSNILACATILKNPNQEVLTNCTTIQLEPSAKRPVASLQFLKAQTSILGQIEVQYDIIEVEQNCKIYLQIETDNAIVDYNERIVASHMLNCHTRNFTFGGLRILPSDTLRVCGWLQFGPQYYHTDSKCANVISIPMKVPEKLIRPKSAPVLPLVLTLVFLGIGIAALVVLYLIVKGYLSDRHKAELFRMRFCSLNNNNNANTSTSSSGKPPGFCMRWTWRFFAWKRRRRHHRPLPNDELMLREDSTFDTSVQDVP